MTLIIIFSFIFIGLIIVGLVLVIGSNELNKRLVVAGGLHRMYASFIESLLAKPKSKLLKDTPSLIVIVGQYDKMNYMWQIRTHDGKNLIVGITLKRDDDIIERKRFKFPISAECNSEDILKTIYQQIKHKDIMKKHIEQKDILENCEYDESSLNSKNIDECPEMNNSIPTQTNFDTLGEHQNGEKIFREDLHRRLEKLVAGIKKECTYNGYSALRVQEDIRVGIIKFFNAINIEEAKSVLSELGSEVDDVDKLFEEERERAMKKYLPEENFVKDDALMS